VNLLFNLVAVQPIHSAKFHGGGSYGEVIFWALVKRGVQFSCAYDSRKYLDPMILDASKTQNITLFDISEKTPQQIIDENQIDTFSRFSYYFSVLVKGKVYNLAVYLRRKVYASKEFLKD